MGLLDNKQALLVLGWNVLVALIYGLDKFFAKNRMRRISENGLLIPAFLLGGLGAAMGMILFNHKTSKIKFRLLVPLAFVFNLLAVFGVYTLQ